MAEIPTIALNDGRTMPQVGLGVYQMPADDTERLVTGAIAAGYRSIDTAMIYGNEEGVGRAVRASDATIFVTTKLWNGDQGYDATLRAFDASMDRLGLDWLDLYLIHWPVPAADRYGETWRALVKLRADGRLRSVGVSNFTAAHLTRIIDETGVVPVTNQIELHPRFQQADLRAFHARHGIATTCWSPLGQGDALADPVITGIAARHGRSAAQVVLRWHVQLGLIVIPKASSAARQAENIALFDFALDDDDMAAIARLDADLYTRVASRVPSTESSRVPSRVHLDSYSTLNLNESRKPARTRL